MHIKDIGAFRRYLQKEFNHTSAGWDPDFIGSRADVNGIRHFGFFNFFQGGTDKGREAIANKLQGILELAQNEQAIYEIAQNAADSGATALSLWYDDKHFLALNDGRQFTTSDLQSILDTFSSEKAYRTRKENEGMIGQYGIGFKLFHRLVGKESGLEELLDTYAGPVIFSWNSREQLEALLSDEAMEVGHGGLDSEAPWLYKILLTCFPVAVGETVRDIDYEERVPFDRAELALFREHVRHHMADRPTHELPTRGSLFYLPLGHGKRAVLDRHMTEIRACMSVSLHFLRDLGAINVNDERIERMPLVKIAVQVPRASKEFADLGFGSSSQDLTLVLGFPADGGDQLIHQPTLYQYFPMSKEKLGTRYVVHCNGLQKQAQRTELNKDSTINERLFERLTIAVIEQARSWMVDDASQYRSLFMAILGSSDYVDALPMFFEQIQRPLLAFIKEHVPTSGGKFLPAEQVIIRKSQLNIPLEEFGIEKHWFYWHADEDPASLDLARDSARLGLKDATLEHLLKKVGHERMGIWITSLSKEEYELCLHELIDQSARLKEYPDLRIIRTETGSLSLRQLVDDPSLTAHLAEWYEAHPDLNEFFPRAELERSLIALAPAEWTPSTEKLLYRLTDPGSKQAMLERLPEIVITPDATLTDEGFMRWWMAQMETPVAPMVRKKLFLKAEDRTIRWDEALISEQLDMLTPWGTTLKLPLSKILPGSGQNGLEVLDRMHDELEAKGYTQDFLELAFKKRKRTGKEELLQLGDRMVASHSNRPLETGAQLAFAVLLKATHHHWTGCKELTIKAANGEVRAVDERWYLRGAPFMDDGCVLGDDYHHVTEYFGENWRSQKFGERGLIASAAQMDDGFTSAYLRDDLTEQQRSAFLVWLLNEWGRSDALRSYIRNDIDHTLLKNVCGADPAQMIQAADEWTLEKERPPTWLCSWIAEEQHRSEIFRALGYQDENDAVVIIREDMLYGRDTSLDSSLSISKAMAVNTLHWMIEKGGASTFRSAKQEATTVQLMSLSDVQVVTEAEPELVRMAVESTDPQYVSWKAASPQLSVFEYPGDLPLVWLWEDRPIARRNGAKVYQDASDPGRIYTSHGYPLMLALHELTQATASGITSLDFERFISVVKEAANKSGTQDTKSDEGKDRPIEEQSLEKQVEFHQRRQVELCNSAEQTLEEVLNGLSWEHKANILARENSSRIRFKEVALMEDGSLLLKRPNMDELPYELKVEQDTASHGLKLELRNKGGATKAVASFTIVANTEGEVRLELDDVPLKISHRTMATLQLPTDEFLTRILLGSWKAASASLPKDRPLVDLISERAPGEQIGFIFGPPGTGKTTELAKRLIATAKETDAQVLVLTPTNNAADVLYERVGELAGSEFDVLRSVHRFGSDNKMVPLQDGLPSIVITTMHRFCFDHTAEGKALSEVDWDHVVFDEASMVPLAYALLPILTLPTTRGTSTWGALGARFLFAGDPFQLLPVGATPSLGDKIEVSKRGGTIRGFATENIFTLTGIDSFQLEEAPRLPGAKIDRLSTNYRSGHSITALFSRSRYNDGVVSHRGNDDHDVRLGSERLHALNLWSFPVEPPPRKDRGEDMLTASTIIPFGNSAVHVHSALFAARLAVCLATENPGKRVIIICPYNRQVRLCQSLLEPFNESCPPRPGQGDRHPVVASSVHRYQGDEAEVAILLLSPAATKSTDDDQLVVGDIALFNNPNLINVGLSRARDVLFVLQPEDKISRDPKRHSAYYLKDLVESESNLRGLDVEQQPTEVMESLLFGGSHIADLVSVIGLRTMDLYRIKDMSINNTDLVVLHSKDNLNLLLARDIVMDGVEGAGLDSIRPSLA